MIGCSIGPCIYKFFFFFWKGQIYVFLLLIFVLMFQGVNHCTARIVLHKIKQIALFSESYTSLCRRNSEKVTVYSTLLAALALQTRARASRLPLIRYLLV